MVPYWYSTVLSIAQIFMLPDMELLCVHFSLSRVVKEEANVSLSDKKTLIAKYIYVYGFVCLLQYKLMLFSLHKPHQPGKSLYITYHKYTHSLFLLLYFFQRKIHRRECLN